MKRPNPPTHAYIHWGGGATGVPEKTETCLGKKMIQINSGEPLEMFWQQGSERPNPPTYAYGYRGEGREAIGVPVEDATGQDHFQNLGSRG